VGGSVSKTLKSLFISTADSVQARTRCCDGCKEETRANNASNNCSFAAVARAPVYVSVLFSISMINLIYAIRHHAHPYQLPHLTLA
jgi:hypothetical protein